LDENLLWLGVPSRSQYDGTPYAAANCGPSALGMILEAYGLWMSTADLRDYANYLQGTYGYNDGIALDHLAEIGKRANLKPFELYDGRGYRRWTIEDVRATVLDGYPVIALTTYRLLPGNAYFGGNINHYIVISGLLGDDFLYNDSSFGGAGGRGLVITAEQLELAWATADIPRHAVAFALGERGDGLLDPSASRLGRGANPLAPLTRLAPASPVDDQPLAVRQPPRRSDAAPAEAATIARARLLADPAPGGHALLDTVLLSDAPQVSAFATDWLDTVRAADDARTPVVRETTTVLAPSIFLVLGGVLVLYILLLVQAELGRRSARRA
jgi:hypothetical protein